MSILSEAADLVGKRLGPEFDHISIERLVVGLFFTGVKLSTGSGGICFTPVKEIPEAVCCPSSAGTTFDPVQVRGTHVANVLAALEASDPIRTAVAIATLNALTATLWDRRVSGVPLPKEGIDAQDVVRLDRGSVALVGAFVPTLRALKRRGGEWWVIEQDPRTLKQDEMPHYIPADQSGKVLSAADVLIVTGVTLVNHTLEPILQQAKPGAEIAIMGPTASMLPDPFFRRGVRVVGGVWVKQPDQLLDILAAGGSGYHFFDDLATRVVLEEQ